MGSKFFLLLGLLMAVVLLISSEVAARDLAGASIDHNEKDDKATATHEIKDDRGGYGGYPGGGYPGRGHGGYPGRGHGGYPGRGHGGYPGRGCRYGCCGHGYHGGCRCCTYAGEAVDSEPETEPQN